MKTYLLLAAGRDRPGLVAEVTKILFQEKCNLEDSAMTRLQGEFAMLLVFSGPARSVAIGKRLATLGRRLGLAVHLRPLGPGERRGPAPRAGVLVTVYGADRPGIVHRVSSILARRRVNITDLSTHRTAGKKQASGYILHIEGETPPALEAARLEELLRKETTGMDVTVSVKPLESQAL